MSTCTDLISAINAVVVDPNLLAQFTASDLATLSNPGTTESPVQLSGGGDAILSVPASPIVDGQLVRLLVCGNVTYGNTAATTATINLRLGPSLASSVALIGGVQNGRSTKNTDLILFDTEFVWSDTFDLVSFLTNLCALNTAGSASPQQSVRISVANQNQLQFFVTGQFSHSDATNQVVITQMKLQLA